MNPQQIILSKDAQGNVTVLNKVPDGVVDSKGVSIDPAYRKAFIKVADVNKKVSEFQTKLAEETALQQAINNTQTTP